MAIPYSLISIVDRPVPYAEALEWQYSLQKQRRAAVALDTLLLLEHAPVITLGRGSVPERDLLCSAEERGVSGIEIYESDRGGEITYHAPGQIVGYPILELDEESGERDLHGYLRRLEQVIIDTIAELGLEGYRKPGLTGVWVNENKIAAIGIKVSRWVTMHGFALNVDLDLTPMRTLIVPCGISTLGVTSLKEQGIAVGRHEVEPVLLRKFESVFARYRFD